jgi:ATP-dependent DNA helicase RecG
LQFLKGVGPRRASDLQRVGLRTVEDLLGRFPLRYEDRGHLRSIQSLRSGERASFAGEIVDCGLRTTRRPGFKIFEALIRDSSGAIRAVWLNQPFMRDVLQRRQRVVLFGPVERRGGGGLQVTNPQYEVLEADEEIGETIHTGRIVPVYERAGSVTPKMQRRIVHHVLQCLPAQLDDPLPAAVRARRGLPERRAALYHSHFPEPGTSEQTLNQFRTPAQVRLIFEEFFLFQIGLLLRRRSADAERKPAVIRVDDHIRASARQVLPFRLTPGQKQALKEIVDDLQRPRAMNRLLQGDVGAGKTIVALLAALVTMENGLQVAFMAPTEILAEQHFFNLRRLLGSSRFRVELLSGSVTAAERRAVVEGLASGKVDLVVGTHALVQEDIAFKALGLAIVDEQHRFGVVQRATLKAKGLMPDVLVMTATPIPRTLALTTYGDLDVSLIRDMPPGRRPVRTLVRPESDREQVYELMRQQLEHGRQAYVVYPLIEESDKVDLRAATEMKDHLEQDVFPAYRVALLHGRMKADAKERVMRAFVAGELQILVSTTVIEVGVDVPNASVMVVEHAERFGLSQLHQLRGRVGRDAHQSFCMLIHQEPLSDLAGERLKAMAQVADGFVLAERDLALRGPGDFFGTRQSGVPTLRVGDLVRDHALMEDARREASAWLDEVGPSAALADWARRNWAARFGLMSVG